MLKAGALLYTVLLSFLISLISGFFILTSSYYNKYLDIAFQQDKLISNVNSAINLVLSDYTIITGQNTKIDLYDEGTDNVEIEQKSWGMYNILNVTAKWRSYFHTKTLLLGDNIFETEKVSLYLVDENNYLSVCGNTKLKGLCYLPKLGVRRAYIEGQSFSGSKLVDGEIKESAKQLPEINKQLLESNISMLKGKKNQNDSIRFYDEFAENDTIFNSFTNKTLVLNTSPSTILNNKIIKGNIVIRSAANLQIDNSVSIEDVLIYAPSVVVSSNFEGSLQIIASDSIIIENDCILKFPSQLCLISEKESFISIDEDCEIAGAVVLYKNSNNYKEHSKIIISEDATIYGQVYCNDMVQLEGKIYGILYCKNFILTTASSVYENHLLNAEIDFSKLNKNFVGINLLNNTKKKDNIKWLY